eukprot:scaffold92031_cov72-Phaeocystis_antarctica.AAC.5
MRVRVRVRVSGQAKGQGQGWGRRGRLEHPSLDGVDRLRVRHRLDQPRLRGRRLDGVWPQPVGKLLELLLTEDILREQGRGPCACMCNVHCTALACALHTHCMRTACALHAHCLCTSTSTSRCAPGRVRSCACRRPPAARRRRP